MHFFINLTAVRSLKNALDNCTYCAQCHISDLLQIEPESHVTAQSLILVYVRVTLTYQPSLSLSAHVREKQPNCMAHIHKEMKLNY